MGQYRGSILKFTFMTWYHLIFCMNSFKKNFSVAIAKVLKICFKGIQEQKNKFETCSSSKVVLELFTFTRPRRVLGTLRGVVEQKRRSKNDRFSSCFDERRMNLYKQSCRNTNDLKHPYSCYEKYLKINMFCIFSCDDKERPLEGAAEWKLGDNSTVKLINIPFPINGRSILIW